MKWYNIIYVGHASQSHVYHEFVHLQRFSWVFYQHKWHPFPTKVATLCAWALQVTLLDNPLLSFTAALSPRWTQRSESSQSWTNISLASAKSFSASGPTRLSWISNGKKTMVDWYQESQKTVMLERSFELTLYSLYVLEVWHHLWDPQTSWYFKTISSDHHRPWRCGDSHGWGTCHEADRPGSIRIS